MARKSNKTTHVLNLIAGAGTEEEEKEGKQEKAEIHQEVVSSAPVKAHSPVVKIMTHDHDPLSDLIKDALETEETTNIKKVASSVSNEGQSDTEISNDTGINSAPAIDNTAAAEIAAKETKAMPPDKQTLAQRLEQSQKLHFHDRTDICSMLDLDFKYVNVYEKIIQDKILEYMRKFDMCMCDRCIVDTFALALTNLPTKIVVTDRDSVFPMISYYETKNTALISTSLIKACMLVKDKPHHE